MRTDNCFAYVKSGKIMRDYPMDKTQGRECNQVQESGLNSDAPKKNATMLSNLGVIKRILPMLLLVCCKYFQFIYSFSAYEV